MGYWWLGKEGTGAVSSRAVCVGADGRGNILPSPFGWESRGKYFSCLLGGESPSVRVGGTGRSPQQARTNMQQAAEVPRTLGRDEGCCCAGRGRWEPGHPAAASRWVASHVPAQLGGRRRTTLPLSLRRGQPVPTTSSERRGDRGPPWGGGSSGRGLLAASPFLFTARGAAAPPHVVCGADVRRR